MGSNPSALKKKIHNLLLRIDPERVGEDDIARLTDEVKRLGAEAPSMLLGYIHHPDSNLRALIGLVLGRLKGEGVEEELFRILEDPNRPPEEKYDAIALLTCIQGYEVDYDRLLQSVIKPEMLQRSLRALLKEGTESEQERVSRWREELAQMSQDSQRFCLRELLAEPDPRVLPFVAAVLDRGGPEVALWVAEGLGRSQIPAEGALKLLSRLLMDGSPLVRRKARESLLQLKRRGVRLDSLFLLSSPPHPGDEC